MQASQKNKPQKSIPMLIVSKVRTIVLRFLIKLSVSMNLPRFTAVLFASVAQRVNKDGMYHVLCLGRSIFTDDVRALATFGKQLQYSCIHLEYFQILFNHFSSADERRQLTEGNYHVTEIGAKSKRKYYQYLKYILPYLQQRLHFHAMLSGNIGYIVQQELARVCEVLRIPFIVLHKEAVVVLDAYDNFLEHYRDNVFIGAKMLFYNRRCMEGFLRLGVKGLTSHNTVTVGIPRFDTYFAGPVAQNHGHKTRPGVVFFSFLPSRSFRFLTNDDQLLKHVEERTEAFFIAVMQYAQRHPDTSVTIKTKMAPEYVAFPTKILSEHFPDGIPNLSIVNTGDPSRLINESRAVIGFNSTTLIEALIAGRLIISPYFGDIMDGISWTFFQNHPDLVHYAKTIEDLEQYLDSPDQFRTFRPETLRDFLMQFISTAEGGASKRTEREIIDAVHKYESYKS